MQEHETQCTKEEMRDPGTEPGGQMRTFAEIQAEIVEKKKSEENEDGSGNPPDGSAP